MQNIIFNKKYIVVILVVVLLALAVLFRDRVSSLLNFGGELNPIVELPEEKPDGENKGQEKPGVLPVYQGRDSAEIRPNPDELKGLSDEQKESLYARIRTHGGEVKANPDYFAGWLEVGMLKKVIGDFTGARDAWEYASIIRPLNSVSFANLGELYWRYLPDYSASEKNLRKALQNDPKDADLYITLAELYHYSIPDKAAQAPGILLEGLKVNPDNDSLMRRLAYLYEQRKEYALAIEWWEKILKQNPGDQSVTDTINKLRAKLGTS